MSPLRDPKDPCRVCGYSPLERGGPGVDSSETECPRCLAQYALDDDGVIEFMFDLPGVPLPRDHWLSVDVQDDEAAPSQRQKEEPA